MIRAKLTNLIHCVNVTLLSVNLVCVCRRASANRNGSQITTSPFSTTAWNRLIFPFMEIFDIL